MVLLHVISFADFFFNLTRHDQVDIQALSLVFSFAYCEIFKKGYSVTLPMNT